MTNRLRIGDRVRFTGPRPDTHDLGTVIERNPRTGAMVILWDGGGEIDEATRRGTLDGIMFPGGATAARTGHRWGSERVRAASRAMQAWHERDCPPGEMPDVTGPLSKLRTYAGRPA